MLSKTEKSSDVCRTASLSEMGHEQRAATSSTVTDQRRKNFFVRRSSGGTGTILAVCPFSCHQRSTQLLVGLGPDQFHYMKDQCLKHWESAVHL